MEKKTVDKAINESRREMLKGMMTLAAAGSVASVSTTTQAVESEQPTNTTSLKKGYHETQHIRDYFDSL